MKYIGPLFAKVSRRYIPLEMMAQDVDALIKENEKLRNDAAEVFIQELTVNGGGMNARLDNQPFTKVLGRWAVESFRASPEAINYISMRFGATSEDGKREEYEMILQRALGKTPAEKNADLIQEIAELKAKLAQASNGL